MTTHASDREPTGPSFSPPAQMGHSPVSDRAIAEAAPIGIFCLDATGRRTYANPRIAEILGIPFHELQEGAAWSRHLHPGDRDRVHAEWSAAFESGVRFQMEYRLLYPDGRQLWVVADIVPLHDDGGRLQGWIGASTEVTGRKQIEENLRESETRLRVLVEQIPAVLWITNTQLRFISAAGTAATKPYSRFEDVAALTLAQLLESSGPAAAPAIEAHERALKGESRSYELPWRGRYFQSHVQPFRDADGNIVGTIGVALDITERHAAEEALRDARDQLERRVADRTRALSDSNAALGREVRERAALLEALSASEQRYAGMLNAQQTLVARADLDARITYMNAAYATALRLKVGESIFSSIHPDDIEKTRAALARLMHPPHTADFENRRRIRDEWRWVHWQYSVIRDRFASISELQAVGFDVTERREAEEALRRSEEHYRELAGANQRLLRELDHRVRNNVAGLLSLVSLMRDRARTVDAFAAAMEARLSAMAHSHQMLAAGGWRPVQLAALAHSLFEAMRGLSCHDAAESIVGPAVEISPAMTPSLAMILVEWFTNSCKYGAHSVPGGRLHLKWDVVPGASSDASPVVRLRWVESGGPPIQAPVVASLGTALVHGFATRELRGHFESSYPPTGAVHVLIFPLVLATAP